MPSYRCVLLWLLLLWPGLAWSQRADLFSAAELAWIKTHPVVRVAVAPNWPPVEYLEGYVHKGLTAEYLAAITRLSGLRFAAVSCENWSIARSALQEGRVELLPAISAELASSALREQIAFSRPYFAGSTLVVTQAATSVIFDPRQLAGKTVAVKGDGAYERTLRERYPGITILPTASPAESLERVARGQADAAIDMDAALLPVLQRRYFDTLHVAGVIVSMPAVLSMGVRADNPLLQAILDKSLAALTAQETDRMVARWLESSEHGLPSWSLLLHHYKWQALAALLVLFSVGMLGYRAFRARQRAEQSEREKSMFLAVMSHEIRTPMHAILASVELLARGRLPAEEARLAQVAVSSSVALLELLDDVLDFSKMEANQLSLECAPTNLRMLLREAVAIADARAADKHLPLSLVLPPSSNEWPVIDAHRVRQILNNLLSNAIKFTERGQVELSARLEPASSGTQRANLSICVSDTGIGISRRQQARLFKAFSQADHSTTRRFGGTGLGLTICHDLVKLMQGSIRVDSEPGKGTRVLVELPVQLAPAIDQSHPAASQVEHSPESKSLQVLVVEDHPVNQFVIERQLKTLGHEVTPAPTGGAGLHLLELRVFDLVLLDCNLPDMDGYAVAQRFREREASTGRHTPIIAISAMVGAEHARVCLEAGMDGLLSKPLRLQELKEIIELWCFTPDAAPTAGDRLDEPDASPLALFLDMTRQDLSSVREAIAARDGLQVARLAHRIHGAALSLKLVEVASCSQRLESHALEGASAARMIDLASHLEKALEALEKI